MNRIIAYGRSPPRFIYYSKEQLFNFIQRMEYDTNHCLDIVGYFIVPDAQDLIAP